MKKLISRVCCLCCVVLVLAACLPFSAFAVDPVSAGVMANAFAQAIAAYGASNGVAMTFDVSNTSGIGESVHELWKDFRAGTQDADDYATLAAALFPDLYYKASSVVGGVSDVYTVGYNISSTYAEEFDNFYNWLLSGPAEMVKVDNSYFQFSDAQVGANATPIVLYGVDTGPFLCYSLPSYTNGTSTVSQRNAYWRTLYDNSWTETNIIHSSPYTTGRIAAVHCSVAYVCAYHAPNDPNGDWWLSCWTPKTAVNGTPAFNVVFRQLTSTTQYTAVFGSNYGQNMTIEVGDFYMERFDVNSMTNNSSWVPPSNIPTYVNRDAALAALTDYVANPSIDSVGVKASTNTGVAEFPDTADPNYEAVGKQIPSTVPWDNTAYGDGTGTLTDAQAGAIAAGADTVIARDGVLDLAGTDETTDEPGVDDPPTTDPDDYVVPGLAEIFPFCIPFDIYNFLSALAANPVAPHFTATLDFPEAVGGSQTIDIDFDSPTWNQLAQLLRLLELLAFIVGLALLTRSMFLRG